jgi:hypothetical protein
MHNELSSVMINKLPPFRTVVAVGFALTLAACGGGDDAVDATTPASDAPEAADAASDDVATAPVTLTLADQSGDGTSVTVGSVDLPSPGFIAVHSDAGGSPGPVIGVSALLPAGNSSEVVVALDEPLTGAGTVFPMAHIDTDGNGVYEFGSVDGPGVTAGGDVAVGPVMITIGDAGSAGGGDTAGAAITIADFSCSTSTRCTRCTTSTNVFGPVWQPEPRSPAATYPTST